MSIVAYCLYHPDSGLNRDSIQCELLAQCWFVDRSVYTVSRQTANNTGYTMIDVEDIGWRLFES